MTTTLSRVPITQVIGTGSDELILKVAQDYYKEDVRFTVTVDGKQVGDVLTVSSINGSGSADTFTLRGDWGGGDHKIEINYLNGNYNAVTKEDSNLWIQSATYNSSEFLASKALWSGGKYSFGTDPTSILTGTAGVDAMAGTRGRDILIGGRGNDCLWGGQGRDIFSQTRGDGYDTIVDFTVAGTGADILRLNGYMISSFADLSQRLTQSGKNTNILLDANNIVVLQNVTASTLTAANFEFVNPLTKKAAVDLSAGTGQDTLVLKLSQDYFVGDDAKFTVSVDGVQVGGTFAASAVRFTGVNDTLTLRGDWGAGTHTVKVNFLNDAFNATTLEDRNLFIQSASINGTNIADASKLVGSGSYSFAAVIAAAVVAPTPVGDGSAIVVPSDPVTAPAPVVTPTHETFTFTNGDGAKTINGFEVSGAGSDILRIDGYGLVNTLKVAGQTSVTNLAELKPLMSQVGSDTVIKVSATDVITLTNVNMADLTDANFSFGSKLQGAMQAATNNGWIVFNNTWGSGNLVDGKDYSVGATYHANSMTTATTFTWDYPPNTLSYTKVLGYPSVMFGSDTFNNVWGEYDPAMVLPVQVKNLTSLTSSYNSSIGGEVQSFDVAYDIWLTNKPNGIWSDITNEVMIWTHRGDMNTYGTKVGTYSDGNYSATIYHIGTYTALVPDKDFLVGTIDVKDVLAKLQALGIVSGDEYVNQIDYGAEPFQGKGSLTLNSLSIDVGSKDAAGIVTKSHADGGVTSQIKEGTAGADILSPGTTKISTLIGGAGNDTFVFTKGQMNTVTVQDFHVDSGVGEHDLLKFVGFGTGAELVHDSGDNWSIHYGSNIDHIVLTGVQTLSHSDYVFV